MGSPDQHLVTLVADDDFTADAEEKVRSVIHHRVTDERRPRVATSRDAALPCHLRARSLITSHHSHMARLATGQLTALCGARGSRYYEGSLIPCRCPQREGSLSPLRACHIKLATHACHVAGNSNLPLKMQLAPADQSFTKVSTSAYTGSQTIPG